MIPPKTGYDFQGWNSQSNGQGTAIADLVGYGLTAYPIWTPKQYTILFKSDYATLFSLSADYNSLLEEPDNPIKEGHCFAGWYTDSALTDAWDFAGDTVTGATTLYAKWTPKTTVSIAETAQTVTYGGSPKAFTISGVPADGFTATYNQGAGNVTPVDPGTYNVVLTRAEDEVYASYGRTIPGGLVIAPAVVSITAIPGLVPPETGAAPVTVISDTAQYTGTVTWSPLDDSFAADMTYKATITLTPKTGYTLTGVTENFFTVAGAAATNAANTGVVTAVFPATETTSLYRLTVTAGTGGSIATGSSGDYVKGAVIAIAAQPAANYSFRRWVATGGGSFADADSAATSFTMPDGAATITAEFNYTGGPSPGGSAPSGPENPVYSANVKKSGGTETTLPIFFDKDSKTAAIDLVSETIAFDGTVITLPSIPDVNTYTVGIPVPKLSTADTQGSLTVETDKGSIIVPSNMLTGVAGANGSKAQVTIGAVKVDELPEAARAAVGNHPVVSLTLTVDGKPVSWNNPDAPVTVSIPYTPTAEELRNPAGITVYYIDGSGKLTQVPGARYDAQSGMVVFETTHFSYYAVGYAKVQFFDVLPGAWYYDAVTFIAERGITTGTGNGKFSPDASLTRGQFITMLLRAYEITPDANPTDNFSDAGSTYYTGYLAAAKRLGISGGVGGNRFAPEQAITRQEMFTLLYNTLRMIGKLPPGRTDPGGPSIYDFADAGDVALWAQEAMTLLVGTGTVGGSGGRLAPTGAATRAEMAQVLYKAMSVEPTAVTPPKTEKARHSAVLS